MKEHRTRDEAPGHILVVGGGRAQEVNDGKMWKRNLEETGMFKTPKSSMASVSMSFRIHTAQGDGHDKRGQCMHVSILQTIKAHAYLMELWLVTM